MGLPKVNRLKNRRDFQAVYEQGIRLYSPHLILRALLNQDATITTCETQTTRIGISISKKVSKKAVTRNLIRRRIQGAIRELLPRISPGWKIVIIVKSQAVECKYEHFLRELEQLFKQATIINGY